MTYNPLIPILTNNIATDATQIQVNFSQLNTLYGLDHFAFDSTVAAPNRGLHQKVTFQAVQGADPGAAGAVGVLYTKTISAKTQLFFQNATLVTQLTGLAATIGTNGFTTLAGGLILQWGIWTGPAAINGVAVTFAVDFVGCKAFPTNCFAVLLQPIKTSVAPHAFFLSSGTITQNGFTVSTDTTWGNGYYMFAIGN